jgi:hypothetical protein
MLDHLAWLPDPQKRMQNFIDLWAPWLPATEQAQFIDDAQRFRQRYSADQAAARLDFTMAERTRLCVTTIGAVDLDKAGRQQRRRVLRRERERQRRARAKAANLDGRTLAERYIDRLWDEIAKRPEDQSTRLMRAAAVRQALMTDQWLSDRDVVEKVREWPLFLSLAQDALRQAVHRAITDLVAHAVAEIKPAARRFEPRHARLIDWCPDETDEA